MCCARGAGGSWDRSRHCSEASHGLTPSPKRLPRCAGRAGSAARGLPGPRPLRWHRQPPRITGPGFPPPTETSSVGVHVRISVPSPRKQIPDARLFKITEILSSHRRSGRKFEISITGANSRGRSSGPLSFRSPRRICSCPQGSLAFLGVCLWHVGVRGQRLPSAPSGHHLLFSATVSRSPSAFPAGEYTWLNWGPTLKIGDRLPTSRLLITSAKTPFPCKAALTGSRN